MKLIYKRVNSYLPTMFFGGTLGLLGSESLIPNAGLRGAGGQARTWCLFLAWTAQNRVTQHHQRGPCPSVLLPIGTDGGIQTLQFDGLTNSLHSCFH